MGIFIAALRLYNRIHQHLSPHIHADDHIPCSCPRQTRKPDLKEIEDEACSNHTTLGIGAVPRKKSQSEPSWHKPLWGMSTHLHQGEAPIPSTDRTVSETSSSAGRATTRPTNQPIIFPCRRRQRSPARQFRVSGLMIGDIWIRLCTRPTILANVKANQAWICAFSSNMALVLWTPSNTATESRGILHQRHAEAASANAQ